MVHLISGRIVELGGVSAERRELEGDGDDGGGAGGQLSPLAAGRAVGGRSFHPVGRLCYVTDEMSTSVHGVSRFCCVTTQGVADSS